MAFKKIKRSGKDLRNAGPALKQSDVLMVRKEIMNK